MVNNLYLLEKMLLKHQYMVYFFTKYRNYNYIHWNKLCCKIQKYYKLEFKLVTNVAIILVSYNLIQMQD